MKYIAPICVMLALSITAYGQQPDVEPDAALPSQTQTEIEQAGQPINAETQVVVQFQIGEVSLTKLRRLGLNIEKLTECPKAKSNDSPTCFGVVNREGQELIELLRKKKLMRVLTEPTLVTTRGKTTVFNSGSQLSVPQRQSDGSLGISQRHAIEIKVTPEVLGDTVSLTLHGRLSELGDGHMVHVGKETIPGVLVREFTTRAELRSGQTLTISGPTQVRMETIARGLPYVSEIPYVGALFRSVEEERNEVAMLVIVRPEIVQVSATAAHPVITSSQGDAPAPQAVRPIKNYGNTFPTARRPANGDTRR